MAESSERLPSGLSVCSLTADPGARVAAALGQLRGVADEIVVAADARADQERLAAYSTVADRVLRVEFDYLERHLAWLHAQCSGDWILRLDGDEVVSPAFVEQLPELLADRRVLQYLLPRRWLYPDPARWLAVSPWRPDYQLRLVRNDGRLRFTGGYHTSAVPLRPARYLDTPLYHLDLVLKDERERRGKAAAYASAHDPITASGGGEINKRFYVPEDSPQAPTLPVPAEDAVAIAAVLNAPARGGVMESKPRLVSLAESDCSLPSRRLEETAYAASAELAEGPLRLKPGERRAVHIRFVNDGTTTWPWDPELGPPIRASYRVRNARGTIVVGDGPRTPFPCEVGPGESCVVPLDTVAPIVPGRYSIEPDVVHEGVRWFGSDARIELEVETPAGWEAALPTRPRRSLLRLRQSTIPRVIHRVWVGDNALPPETLRWEETWRRHHPEWELRLWGDDDIAQLVPAESLARCRTASEQTNIVRYALLARHGGVYVDTDVECLRPIDPLLRGVQAFAAWETEHRLGTAVLGAAPGTRVFRELADFSCLTSSLSIDSVEGTGPGLFTLVAADHPEVTRFDKDLFYPYRWDEPHRRHEPFPGSYAVHHWSLSWRDGS